MKIPGDIAGATFMAAGSSMPTLFICIISLFLGESAIGLGTIIGSTLFNILFITAASSLLAVNVLRLQRWPLLRDSFAYSLHLLALLIIIADSKVHWYEGLSILLLYGMYILTLIYDVELHSLCKRFLGNLLVDEEENNSTRQRTKSTVTQTDESSSEYAANTSTHACSPEEFDGDPEVSRERNLRAVHRIIEQDQQKHNSIFFQHERSITIIDNEDSKADEREAERDENESEEGTAAEKDLKSDDASPFRIPSSWAHRVLWGFILPIRLLYFVTMPDVRRERWQNWYPATFLISIAWMAIISYILVWAVAVIGETLRFPEALMGLFLLAAGSSVPDAIASVVVARRGDGDMAIASCVGSNIFDIVCLAIPWIVVTSVVHPNSVVLIEGEHMVFTSLTLFGSIVACVLIIHINKWRLTKRTGITFIVVYVLFMIVCGVIELIPLHANESNIEFDRTNSSEPVQNYTRINTSNIPRAGTVSANTRTHLIIYDTRNRANSY